MPSPGQSSSATDSHSLVSQTQVGAVNPPQKATNATNASTKKLFMVLLLFSTNCLVHKINLLSHTKLLHVTSLNPEKAFDEDLMIHVAHPMSFIRLKQKNNEICEARKTF